MKSFSNHIILISILVCCTLPWLTGASVNHNLDLMPMPAEVIQKEGMFQLNTSFTLGIEKDGSPRLKRAGARMLARLAGRTGLFFEAGNLPDVSNLQGWTATSLYTDYKGHAGDVLKALIELIWIDAIYGVDLDNYAYDPGYQTDLKALAKSIMDAHDPAYNGPNR